MRKSDTAKAKVELAETPRSDPPNCKSWSGCAWKFRSGFAGAFVGTLRLQWGLSGGYKLIQGYFKVLFFLLTSEAVALGRVVLFGHGFCPRDAGWIQV